METVPSPDLKLCVRCEVEQERSEFHRDRRRKDGLFPYCKACRYKYDGRTPRPPRMFATKAEYDRVHRQTMPQGEKTTRHRERHLWSKFRMTVEDYDHMLTSQGGRCAICRGAEARTSSKYGRPSHFAVDHDHACCPSSESCGRCVRGLLCHRCNTAIGHLNDDPTLLLAAVAYLAREATCPETSGTRAAGTKSSSLAS